MYVIYWSLTTNYCTTIDYHILDYYTVMTSPCAMSEPLTLLQCLPIPIKKLSGLISLCMKFLLCTYSIRPIIYKYINTV